MRCICVVRVFFTDDHSMFVSKCCVKLQSVLHFYSHMDQDLFGDGVPEDPPPALAADYLLTQLAGARNTFNVPLHGLEQALYSSR